LKLFLCVVPIAVVVIQQSEIVVYFRAGVVLLEERAILRNRPVKIADTLVVQRQAEVIGGR